MIFSCFIRTYTKLMEKNSCLDC